MTIETLSEVVSKSLSIPDLSKLTAFDRDKSQGHMKAVASLLPYVGGAAAEELQKYYDYKDDEFFRKFVGYLMELKETTAEERSRFAQDVQEIAEDFSGNVICGMVDRLDNINKEKAFAKLTVARIHGRISIQDFFRLHSLLERIPYVDLKLLPQYKEPYYDESGDTELLYSTGALELVSIDADGGTNKYVLSRLGEMLLLWGFNIYIELEHGKGTELGLITQEKFNEIFDDKIKASQPRFENETLYFPDGTKSGKMEDDDMFLYDVARGK